MFNLAASAIAKFDKKYLAEIQSIKNSEDPISLSYAFWNKHSSTNGRFIKSNINYATMLYFMWHFFDGSIYTTMNHKEPVLNKSCDHLKTLTTLGVLVCNEQRFDLKKSDISYLEFMFPFKARCTIKVIKLIAALYNNGLNVAYSIMSISSNGNTKVFKNGVLCKNANRSRSRARGGQTFLDYADNNFMNNHLERPNEMHMMRNICYPSRFILSASIASQQHDGVQCDEVLAKLIQEKM